MTMRLLPLTDFLLTSRGDGQPFKQIFLLPFFSHLPLLSSSVLTVSGGTPRHEGTVTKELLFFILKDVDLKYLFESFIIIH